VVGLFAMFLTASVARAEEAKAPDPQPVSSRSKMPLRVVRVLAESHQALLYDKIRGTHVLAEVGGTVGGYEVVEIADDEVTLYANGREFVLAAPAELPAPKPTRAPAKAKVTAPMDPYQDAGQNADGGPQDPYAETPVRAVSAAPVITSDPYADPAVRSVSASPDAGQNADSGAAPRAVPPTTAPAVIPSSPAAELDANPYDDAPVPSVTAPAKPAAKAPAKPARSVSLEGFLPPGTSPDDATAAKSPAPAPAAPAPAPAATKPGMPADPYWVDGQVELPPSKPVRVVTEDAPAAREAAPAPAAPPAPVITPTVLSRSELNATIGDFNKLAGVLRGSFTPEGARLDAVAEGSVFAKAGLRRGDIVTAVDGMPLRSIDDAAELYVRAANTKAANIQLVRAGKPMTMRVLIQ
jgi:2-oxoglutarate dehydrogenase E2 component (dihydrolipoamide succinyltransferase)